MEEVINKINVIEAILASPLQYPDKTTSERFTILKNEFPGNKSIYVYFNFPTDKLQDQLKLLQEEKVMLIMSSGSSGPGKNSSEIFIFSADLSLFIYLSHFYS